MIDWVAPLRRAPRSLEESGREKSSLSLVRGRRRNRAQGLRSSSTEGGIFHFQARPGPEAAHRCDVGLGKKFLGYVAQKGPSEAKGFLQSDQWPRKNGWGKGFPRTGARNSPAGHQGVAQDRSLSSRCACRSVLKSSGQSRARNHVFHLNLRPN
jgi:hypothetical protein